MLSAREKHVKCRIPQVSEKQRSFVQALAQSLDHGNKIENNLQVWDFPLFFVRSFYISRDHINFARQKCCCLVLTGNGSEFGPGESPGGGGALLLQGTHRGGPSQGCGPGLGWTKLSAASPVVSQQNMGVQKLTQLLQDEFGVHGAQVSVLPVRGQHQAAGGHGRGLLGG